jgi:hypothetical protein
MTEVTGVNDGAPGKGQDRFHILDLFFRKGTRDTDL